MRDAEPATGKPDDDDQDLTESQPPRQSEHDDIASGYLGTDSTGRPGAVEASTANSHHS